MLKKITSYNFILYCALAYLIKALIVSVSLSDSLILVCLFTSYSFKEYLKFKEPKITDLDIFKEEVNKALKLVGENALKQQKSINELTSSINNVSSKLKISEHVVKPTQQKRYF